MLYTALLSRVFRTIYGPLPEPGARGAAGGLVLLADGVGGFDLCAMGLKYAAAWEHLPYEIRVLRWGHGLWRWYKDLSNVENQRAQAATLAAEVEVFRGARPEAPVFLIGKSGGTGVVARALELLPDDAVEASVLLAPALSPGYDLSRALRAVRRELVVFRSPLDRIVLGLGTRLFGTIDRVHTPAAGLHGFRTPEGLEDAAAAQYAKLRQIVWNPAMWRTGYFGGHTGVDHPAFLRRYVLPLLRPDSPVPLDTENPSS